MFFAKLSVYSEPHSLYKMVSCDFGTKNNDFQVFFISTCMSYLCDTFLVPSLLAILIYVLNILTKEGAFDAIVYGVKLAFYTTFYSNIRKTKLPATYGEYRELKRGQKRTNLLYIVFSAVPYIIVGLAYYILYSVSI